MSAVNRRQITIFRTLEEADDGGYMPGSAADRLLEVWELTREACAFSLQSDAESRLQRDVGVLIRREG
jgi:hypothetical protein